MRLVRRLEGCLRLTFAPAIWSVRWRFRFMIAKFDGAGYMLQFTSVTPAKVTSVCSKHDENPKTRLAFREIVDETRPYRSECRSGRILC